MDVAVRKLSALPASSSGPGRRTTLGGRATRATSNLTRSTDAEERIAGSLFCDDVVERQVHRTSRPAGRRSRRGRSTAATLHRRATPPSPTLLIPRRWAWPNVTINTAQRDMIALV